MNIQKWVILATIALLAACKSQYPTASLPSDPISDTKAEPTKAAHTEISSTPKPSQVQLRAETIQKHLAELSSDKYMGRMPCTEGGLMTAAYLEKELKALGLEAPDNGSYFQDVPLLSIDGTIADEMTVAMKDKNLIWQKGKDFILHTERKVDRVDLKDSELVFCGYGIVDEKLGWNDYAGIDMKGKTAVILINDPGFGGDDPNFFKGDIMTYAGRWDYKYDTADAQGADGLLIIHETASASYPWFVVESSWTGPQAGLSGIDRSSDCSIKGWIHLDKARELFNEAGLDFTTEVKAARVKGYQPKSLNAKVTSHVDNTYKECISQNVVGLIPGSKYPDEYVIYTAHWDHIGIGKVVEGDSIYNGALDNASGVATLLALAEGFTQSATPPERSVVFLLVTAEEQGLLGSEYYIENPIFPISKTVCNLNMDGVNPHGLMKDLTITGKGHSEMDIYAEEAAKAQGRYVIPEQEPEKGYFFRSDQFNFAKFGIPVLYAEGGYDHMTKGKAYAKEVKTNFTNTKYHAPADEYDPATWQMEGMIQDAELYYNIGFRIANSRDWPKWFPASEFSRKKTNNE